MARAKKVFNWKEVVKTLDEVGAVCDNKRLAAYLSEKSGQTITTRSIGAYRANLNR